MKTIIIGAGLAGSNTAISILENNSGDVILIDSDFTRLPIKCGCGTSLEMLNKAGVKEIPKHLIDAFIKRVEIYSPNDDFWMIETDDYYGYILKRNEWDKWFISKAEKLGATLIEKKIKSVKDLPKYDFLVGADGVNSVVKKWLNINQFSEDIHHGIQKTVYWKNYPKDTLKMYFGNKIAPSGYAWVFPAENGLVRVGLGVSLSLKLNIKKLLDQFMLKIEAPSKGELISKLIPTDKFPNKTVYGNTILVGDALPSTDPLTGGGICQAIACGKAAGKAIADNKLNNFNKYIKWLKKQNRLRYRLKKIVTRFSDDDFNFLVETMKNHPPKTLSIGREIGKAIIRILLRKPLMTSKFK